jgi:hypothetical protein
MRPRRSRLALVIHFQCDLQIVGVIITASWNIDSVVDCQLAKHSDGRVKKTGTSVLTHHFSLYYDAWSSNKPVTMHFPFPALPDRLKVGWQVELRGTCGVVLYA